MKYAIVKNGLVWAVFYSDEPKSSYPDIEPYLMEVNEEIQCNWVYINNEFKTNVVEE